jgi:virulence-associated protein VagC
MLLWGREVLMKTTKVFEYGKGQAVCLLPEFCVDGNEMWISKKGDIIELRPKQDGWVNLEKGFALLSRLDQDLVLVRDAPDFSGKILFD